MIAENKYYHDNNGNFVVNGKIRLSRTMLKGRFFIRLTDKTIAQDLIKNGFELKFSYIDFTNDKKVYYFEGQFLSRQALQHEKKNYDFYNYDN